MLYLAWRMLVGHGEQVKVYFTSNDWQPETKPFDIVPPSGQKSRPSLPKVGIKGD